MRTQRAGCCTGKGAAGNSALRLASLALQQAQRNLRIYDAARKNSNIAELEGEPLPAAPFPELPTIMIT